MDDDADEDVIFENSPLYQHLLEAGVENIDTEPVVKTRSTAAASESRVIEVSRLAHICERCASYVKSLFHRRKEGNDKLVQSYQHKMLHILCSSPVLVEDDQLFLEEFAKVKSVSPECLPLGSQRKWGRTLLLTLVLPCVLAYAVSRVMTSGTTFNLTYDLLSCSLGVVGLVYLGKQCVTHRRRRGFETICTTVSEFLDASRNLLNLTRKSLRLIQETELVARGFTLVSQKSAVSQLDRKPSASTIRQCPELRKYLFTMARTATLTWRLATLRLIELHPLIPEIDCISNYLAGIALEEYGPCLQDIPEEEELYHLTDGFSVAALKAMTELFGLHLSEFIRRLALCFSPSCQTKDDINYPFKTISIISELEPALKEQETTLDRLYHFHKSSPQGRQPKLRQPQSKTASPAQDFYVAIHSLDLHLQSALSRVRNLADKLESQLEKDSSTTESAEEILDEKLETVLSSIKAELEACKGCWEEGLVRLEKSKKQVPKLDVPPDMDTEKMEPRAIPFLEIGDPIIEDQVFEAYTDSDKVEPSTWSWEPLLTPEEKEKRKREKEEALRLLRELKSVISVRAKDWERREKAALVKMGKGDITLSKSTTGSDGREITQPENSKDFHLDPSVCTPTASDERNESSKQKNIVLDSGDAMSDIRLGEDNSDLTTFQNLHAELKPEMHLPSTLTSDHSEERNTQISNTSRISSASKMTSASEGHLERDNLFTEKDPKGHSNDNNVPATNKWLTETAELKERLERIHRTNLGFTADVAAMAAAKSVSLGLREQTFGDTFGDEDSEEEEEESLPT